MGVEVTVSVFSAGEKASSQPGHEVLRTKQESPVSPIT